MKTFELSFPELGFVAATRGMAGAGIGLLVADAVPPNARKAIGWTLFAIGALTTIPIALTALGRRKPSGTSFPTD
jgi:hypothetical protein